MVSRILHLNRAFTHEEVRRICVELYKNFADVSQGGEPLLTNIVTKMLSIFHEHVNHHLKAERATRHSE